MLSDDVVAKINEMVEGVKPAVNERDLLNTEHARLAKRMTEIEARIKAIGYPEMEAKQAIVDLVFGDSKATQ